MTRTQKYWLLFALAIPPGIVVTLHAYLGSFTRLMADDYCTLYFTIRLGVLRTAWYWYLNFAGVYARSFINKILLLIGPDTMWVIVPGALILWLAAVAVVLYLLLEKEDPSISRSWIFLPWSITFIYLVLLLSPQLSQSLYWWGGFSAYTAPLILGTFHLAVFLMLTRREWKKSTFLLWGIASFLMAFCLGGISESFSPVLLVFMAFATGWGMATRRLTFQKPALWFLSAGLLGTLLALIVMVSAPGNAIRQSYFPAHPGMMKIFQIAVREYLDYLKTLLIEPQKSAGILGVWLGSLLVGLNKTAAKQPNLWTAPAVMIVCIFLAFLCFPPAVFGTSEPPPDRVLVISAFALSVGVIASGYVSGNWLSGRIRVDRIHGVTGGFILATIVLMCYSTWMTSRTLYGSRNVFMEFANKWDQADARIRQAKEHGETSITIPAMDNWAGLERPNDNERYWVNKCYSAYYGIEVYGPPYNP